jgi:hypothetical protein
VPDGLKFRLSEGVEGAEKHVKQGLPSTDPLSDPNSLLKRLPAIKSDPDDQTDFAKARRVPARTEDRPKNTCPSFRPIKIVVPSEGRHVPGRRCRCCGIRPDGEISLTPDLSVTFSQPMVAVTPQEQAAGYAPVELSPQVEGRWRWLGTKTLMFDTDKRFPMATQFTARVPAGTKSANGLAQQKDVVWTFTTPPPKVEQMLPAKPDRKARRADVCPIRSGNNS